MTASNNYHDLNQHPTAGSRQHKTVNYYKNVIINYNTAHRSKQLCIHKIVNKLRLTCILCATEII